MRAAAPAALLDNARICALANSIVVAAGAPVIRPFPSVVWYGAPSNLQSAPTLASSSGVSSSSGRWKVSWS
ncbi:hypothetical protein ACQJBY_033407 [Aegilops geniculata]